MYPCRNYVEERSAGISLLNHRENPVRSMPERSFFCQSNPPAMQMPDRQQPTSVRHSVAGIKLQVGFPH